MIARRLSAAILLAVLAGCASIAKVETGPRTIGERLTVQIDGPWNQVNAPGLGPAIIWTMEGLPVDQLMIYTGVRDGAAINATPRGSTKSFNFRATMEPEEIEAMFEAMLTQDGSSMKLTKLEPAPFGGQRGYRFEFDLVRKKDNVHIAGIAYGAISKRELFAIVYVAPRLTFFPRHVASVVKIAESARIKE